MQDLQYGTLTVHIREHCLHAFKFIPWLVVAAHRSHGMVCMSFIRPDCLHETDVCSNFSSRSCKFAQTSILSVS